jgi:energy-coupling factor transporter transmembrane protein EcfT
LHPYARLTTAILAAVTAFLLYRPEHLAALHALVVLAACGAGIGSRHLRFVATVGLPLLVALLIVWGVINPPRAAGQLSGVAFALASWLRIVILGGVFQWLMLPLANHPVHLKAFLQRLRLPSSSGALLVAPILFLPEIRRRLGRIVDARRAQGLPSRGLAGARALPAMITPLVASLLETSLARSELWSHRRVLERDVPSADVERYPLGPSLAATSMAVAVLLAALAQWI